MDREGVRHVRAPSFLCMEKYPQENVDGIKKNVSLHAF